MMSPYAIILIETKSEYWRLKGNQGTVIAMNHCDCKIRFRPSSRGG